MIFCNWRNFFGRNQSNHKIYSVHEEEFLVNFLFRDFRLNFEKKNSSGNFAFAKINPREIFSYRSFAKINPREIFENAIREN